MYVCMNVGEAMGEIKEVVLARNHSALLTNSGRVYVWGESAHGRLGISESSRLGCRWLGLGLGLG